MKKIPITVITLISLLISMSGCSRKKSTESSHHRQDSLLRERTIWLKQYALCNCLRYAFNKDTAVQKDISVGIYRDITGGLDIRVYNAIDSLSKQAALQIAPSEIADYNGKKPFMLGCMNYYESKSLDSLLKKHEKDISGGLEQK